MLRNQHRWYDTLIPLESGLGGFHRGMVNYPAAKVAQGGIS